MPGFIATCAVSCRLSRMNFAGITIPTDKAETEAFQASEGLNTSRIQVYVLKYNALFEIFLSTGN
jgi:hypothetical protein